MTARDTARLNEALGLLHRGRLPEATSIVERHLQREPRSADALHLLALCRKAANDLGGAVHAFEAALAQAPHDANLLGNYANLLCRMGRTEEAIALYRRVLETTPGHGDGWMNLGLALLDSGDTASACDALARAVDLRPESAAAWHGLGSARRAADDLEGAERALRRAVALAPGAGAAWTSLGVVRRMLGDPAESLDCYGRARRAGFSGPELDDAEASAHLDLGDPARALAGARRLVGSAPGYVPGHVMLAHLLWEHGDAVAPGEDPRAAFSAAVAAQPGHRALGLEYIRFLLDSGAPQEALAHIRTMRRDGGEPSLVASEAQALATLGETDAAGRVFAAAYASLSRNAGFLGRYAAHLLKAGQAEPAAARALEALERAPHDQTALAYLGVAWRLLEDPREEWLCGYDRLVGEVAVEPPAGSGDEAAFLRALEATLLPMHTARREPVNQSLRGGSQTAGVLFGRRDPAIVGLRDAIARAVQRHVATLPDDPDHPFLQRKAAGARFVGSWSVRLWSSGRHANHFHHAGWMSSAFYVSLPPSVAAAREGDRAGCLQFGQPPAELGLALAPRRIVRPRAGRLVLFPSYLWHGTVPFTDDAPRLTVAFDAVPVA